MDDNPLLEEGQPLHGITTCNIRIGSEQFVKGYLCQKGVKITRGSNDIMELLDPGRWPHPEIPSRQMLWILTAICFQFMGDYWLRHVRPDYTEDFVRGIDDRVDQLFQMCNGIDTSSWSDFAKERIRLPINLKGCGLRQAVDWRYGKFVGAVVQSTLPLLTRTDSNGNAIEGRLDIPCLINLLGETSFDFPLTTPWNMLMEQSNPSHNLASGLKNAWTHLTTSFQDVASTDQTVDMSLLLNQGVESAGFYPDDTIASSVTKAITVELEKARATNLDEK